MEETMAEQEGVGTMAQQAMAAVDSVEETQTEEAVETHAEEAAPAEEAEGADEGGPLDLEAIFAEEAEEEQKADSDDDDEPEETQQEAPKGNRANKRIRALSSKLKEENGKYSELNAYTHKLYQAYLRQEERLTQLQKAPKVQKKVESDDPVDAFKAEILDSLQSVIDDRLREPNERVKRIEQDRQNAATEFQRRQRVEKLNREVDKAVEEEILPYVDEETGTQLKENYARMVMLLQASDNKGLKASAQEVRKVMMKNARGVVKKRTKANGKKVAASQATPSPSPQGISGATGDSFPSWEALRKNNYRTYVQWQADGSPPLK